MHYPPQEPPVGSERGMTQPNPRYKSHHHQPRGGGDYTQPHQPQRGSEHTVPHPVRPSPHTEHTVQSPAARPKQSPGSLRYQRPPSQPSRPDRKRKSNRKINCLGGCGCGPGCLMGCGLFSTITLITVLVSSWLVYVAYAERVQESIDEAEQKFEELDQTAFESSYIYDRRGNELYEVLGEGRRQPVSLDEVSDYAIWATIATEDDTFYDNMGVDIPSILRASRDYFREGEIVSGASTITQQLVRQVVFDEEYRQERTLQRKIDEALLAVVLTQRMSKDEILELYLNYAVYYGNLAYGIEAAAQVYFGKPASQLALHEAALLAGLPQQPGELNPLSPDPFVQQRVKTRQATVLDLMVEEGYITREEAEAAKLTPLNYASPEIPLDQAPHFVVFARAEAEKILQNLGYSPEFLANGGLEIYTSLDMEFQGIAENAARNHVAALRDQHNLTNASVVAIHPPSGEIMAMVGSIDYYNESIDGEFNVSLAARQPGSTIKALTYAAALEQGWTAASVIWDTELVINIPGQEPYRPRNYVNRFNGPMTVRTALANSYNIPAVQTLRKVSIPYFLDFARRFGIQSFRDDPSTYGPSLTLGGGEVTLLELTNAYGNFARQGNYVEPQAIMCILDKDDNIIYQYEGRCRDVVMNPERIHETTRTVNDGVQAVPILDSRIAFLISDILADNNARSAAMGANSPLVSRDPAGNILTTSVKTGTTNDFRDNWTVGFTHDMVIGVWSGNSDNSEMINISGLQGAAPIWRDTMQGIYFNTSTDFPPAVIPNPGGLSRQSICDVRSLRQPSEGCPSTTSEWFLDSTALVPDGQGGLTPSAGPPQRDEPGEFGPRITPVQPGIVRVHVRPLIPEQGTILASLNGDTSGVVPEYCMVPLEVVNAVPDAREQLFIEPPPVAEDAVRAYRYAQQTGYQILPRYACREETLVAAGPPAGPGEGWEVNPTSAEPWRTAAVYCQPDGSIDVYAIQSGEGVFVFRATPAEINAIGVPAENTPITAGAGIVLYRLASGEFQVNAPVDGDPNGYVVTWPSCIR